MRNTILAMLLLVFCPMMANAEYPDRPIKIVVPMTAGSATDNVARQLAEEMAKDLKQPLVIDNKGGAQGIIGVQSAITSPSDGYTLVVLGVTTAATNVSLYKNLPYDPLKDLTPIGMISVSPTVLIASPNLEAKNTSDLFQLARKNPGKLTFGYGSGSVQICGAKLIDMGRIDVLQVAYRGAPQVLTDLMAGRVDFTFIDIGLALPQARAGKIKVLGVTSKDRFSLLPDVPSINESGAPGYDLFVWFGLAAPANIPKEAINRLSTALHNAQKSKDLIEKYAQQALAVEITTPDEFKIFMKSEIEKWGAIVRAAGIEAKE